VTLLSPWTLALAAGIFLPILLALYMLRLRREPRRIASTLLWQSVYEDLLANVPFQRLRWSVLLLLQAIALLLIATALARPTAPSATALGARTIVLVDVGASMGLVVDPDSGATRLDLALAEVESMIRAKPSSGELMIIAFAAAPRVVCGFDRNPTVLRNTLRTLADGRGQTDEPSDLDAALQVAESFSRPSESDDDVPAMVVVVTDGQVRSERADRRFEIAAGATREVRIGGGGGALVGENLGIVELDARRREDDPSMVEIFVRLHWTGAEPLSVPIVFDIDGETVRRRIVAVPAAGADERVDDARGSGPTAGPGPGAATVIEQIEIPDAALLVVRHTHSDVFETDDIAAAVVPAPRRLRIALVCPDGRPDAFVRDLLVETEPEELEILTPAQWQEIRRAEDRFDLAVFDRVDAATWPEIPSISFGAAPPGVVRNLPDASRRATGRRLLGWNRLHPLLRHADIGDLLFAGVTGLDLPEGAEALALGPDGPVIAIVRHAGIRHVVVAFTLLESTLPVLPGYPVFIQNAIDLLAGEAGAAALVPRTGASTRFRIAGDVERVLIRDGDDLRTLSIPEGARAVTFPVAQRVGVRHVESVPPDRLDLPGGLLPASLLSATESDLRPQPPLTLVATAVPPGGEVVMGRAEWWPWALLVALTALAVEWLVYTRRAGV